MKNGRAHEHLYFYSKNDPQGEELSLKELRQKTGDALKLLTKLFKTIKSEYLKEYYIKELDDYYDWIYDVETRPWCGHYTDDNKEICYRHLACLIDKKLQCVAMEHKELTDLVETINKQRKDLAEAMPIKGLFGRWKNMLTYDSDCPRGYMGLIW